MEHNRNLMLLISIHPSASSLIFGRRMIIWHLLTMREWVIQHTHTSEENHQYQCSRYIGSRELAVNVKDGKAIFGKADRYVKLFLASMPILWRTHSLYRLTVLSEVPTSRAILTWVSFSNDLERFINDLGSIKHSEVCKLLADKRLIRRELEPHEDSELESQSENESSRSLRAHEQQLLDESLISSSKLKRTFQTQVLSSQSENSDSSV